jgi:hypothetical protein
MIINWTLVEERAERCELIGPESNYEYECDRVDRVE